MTLSSIMGYLSWTPHHHQFFILSFKFRSVLAQLREPPILSAKGVYTAMVAVVGPLQSWSK